ncbi:MAG: PAS domain S-box protein [Bacteroidetes bacterium]|nr:PAS domain S-box protein [Bacteroidota bacterium]
MSEKSAKEKIQDLIFGNKINSPFEDRIFVLMTFLTTLTLLSFTIINIIYILPEILVLINLVSTLTAAVYFLIVRKFENLSKLRFPFFIISLPFLFVAWFVNAGIDGLSIIFTIAYFVGLYSITDKKYRFWVFACLIVMVSGLILIQHFFPDSIIGFMNDSQRYAHYFFGTIVCFVFIYLLIDLIIKNYEKENTKVEESNKKLSLNEEKLRDLNEFQRAILDSAGYAIITTDTKGVIKSFNPAAEQMLGYKADEVIDKTSPDIFHSPADVKARAEKLLIDTDESFKSAFELTVYQTRKNLVNEQEWTYCHKDGSEFPVLLKITGLYDNNGSITGFLGIANDIKKRKIAETELRQRTIELEESEEKYRTLFEESHDAILIIDNHVFVDCNNAALEILKCKSKSELANTHPSKLSPPFQPDGRASFEKAEEMMTIAQTKGSHRFEWVHRRSNGEDFYAEVSLTIIPFQGRQIIHTAWRDISERQMMIEEIIKTKEKAEKANQLKSEFLAQMSHEIRSPINSILNFTSLVEELTIGYGNHELEECFSSIDNSSKRVIRTIDAILNMSELQLGTYQKSFRKTDIKDMLERLVAEYRRTAATKNLSLKLNITTSETVHYTDEYAANQIFANLIDNAIKYTNEGEISVSLNRSLNGSLFARVQDTGQGISKEYLPYLFEPFSQEQQGYSRKFDGNGLGMSLVKRYCEIIGAEISVKSNVGTGTEFQVLFNSRAKK